MKKKQRSRSILDAYRDAGAVTSEQILAMAAGVGKQALLEARAALFEGPASKDMHDELEVIMDRAEQNDPSAMKDAAALIDKAIELYNSGEADGDTGDYQSTMKFGRFNWDDFNFDGTIKSSVPREERIGLLRYAAHLALLSIVDPSMDKMLATPYAPRQKADSNRLYNAEKSVDELQRQKQRFLKYIEQVVQLSVIDRRVVGQNESHLVEGVGRDMHDWLDVVLDMAESQQNYERELAKLTAAIAHHKASGDVPKPVYSFHVSSDAKKKQADDWWEQHAQSSNFLRSYNAFHFNDNGIHKDRTTLSITEHIAQCRQEAHACLAIAVNDEWDPRSSKNNIQSMQFQIDRVAHLAKARDHGHPTEPYFDFGDEKFESRIVEGVSSTVAIAFVKALPFGKNISAWVRKLAGQYDKVICMVEAGRLPYQTVLQMISSSLPDVASKIETYELGEMQPTLRNVLTKLKGVSPAMKDGGAADIMADDRDAPRLSSEINAGNLPVDASAIRVIPAKVPKDSDERITQAIRANDQESLQQLLDPMVFSDQSRLQAFRVLTSEARMVGGHWDSFPKLHDDLDYIMDAAEHGQLTNAMWEQYERELPQQFVDEIDLRLPDAELKKVTVDRGLAGPDNRTGTSAEMCAVERSWAHYYLDRAIHSFILHRSELNGEHDLPTYWRRHVQQQINNLGLCIDSVDAYAHPTPELLKAYPNLLGKKKNSQRPEDNNDLNETGTYSNMPMNANGLRGNNSSAWSSGKLVLANPRNFVPEDESQDSNENYPDRILDIGFDTSNNH